MIATRAEQAICDIASFAFSLLTTTFLKIEIQMMSMDEEVTTEGKREATRMGKQTTKQQFGQP